MERASEAFRTFGSAYSLIFAARQIRLKTITVKTKIGKLCLRPTDSDAETFTSVFDRGPYNLSRLAQHARVLKAYHRILADNRSPLIIDAGANVGAASLWFAAQFPMAKIIAIEPEQEAADLCRKNLRNAPNATVIKSALGSASGYVSVEKKKKSDATRVAHCPVGDTAMISVQEAIRVAGSEAVPFIIKVDIEGFEKDLFSRDTSWLNEFSVLFVEPHDWLMPGQQTSGPFLKAIADQGMELLILGGDTLAFVR